MKKVSEITIGELREFTKTQLIKVAKSRYAVALKTNHRKDEMISAILKVVRANKRLSSVVGTKKMSAVKPQRNGKTAMATKLQPKATAVKGRMKKAREAFIKPKLNQASVYKSPESVTCVPSGVEEKSGEETVQGSKYYVATAQERMQPAYEPPQRYEDDRITAFVRDPFWIFSFWDIHPQTERRVAARYELNGNCETTLRVYDVTGIDFNGHNANAHFDIEVNAIAGDWYVNVPEDGKTYCLEIGLKNSAGNFYMLSRSNAITLPRSGVSDRLDEEWMIADDDFWRMYAMSGGFAERGPGSSEEIFGEMQKRLRGELSSGAVSSFGASETLTRQKPDDFWFRLDCELIVFGATRPNAEVTLGGKPIKLQPDGTFTERFALPNGIQMLPAKAISADRKYEKTITPTVSRSTALLNVDASGEYEEEEQE